MVQRHHSSDRPTGTGQVLPLDSDDDGALFSVKVTIPGVTQPLTSKAEKADIAPTYAQVASLASSLISEAGQVSANEVVSLGVWIYGLQDKQDQALGKDVTFAWTANGSSISDASTSKISYKAPSSPGRYTVVASIGDRDCQPDDEDMREAACSASFEVRVRRPSAPQPDAVAPVNPPATFRLS